MKLSDFNQITSNTDGIKPSHHAWDLIFVCLVLFIASSSFIYDSYQESNPIKSLKGSEIRIQ